MMTRLTVKSVLGNYTSLLNFAVTTQGLDPLSNSWGIDLLSIRVYVGVVVVSLLKMPQRPMRMFRFR